MAPLLFDSPAARHSARVHRSPAKDDAPKDGRRVFVLLTLLIYAPAKLFT